jgi:hypothetical protein
MLAVHLKTCHNDPTMKERVKRELIDRWIKDAYPNGLYKLSIDSKIPVNSLTKIRLGTFIPKDPNTREALAKVLGCKESELFPASGKSRAS